MKILRNHTGVEKQGQKEMTGVKEDWKVGRTVNQNMQEEKFVSEERWKSWPSRARQLKTQAWRPIVNIEKVAENLQSEPEP